MPVSRSQSQKQAVHDNVELWVLCNLSAGCLSGEQYSSGNIREVFVFEGCIRVVLKIGVVTIRLSPNSSGCSWLIGSSQLHGRDLRAQSADCIVYGNR